MDVLQGAMAEDQVHALASRIAQLFGLTIVPETVVMVAAAPILLLPCGANYAREGAPVQLRSLDVFLSRSPWEALPIAAPDAMACAVPQDEMNVGGTPEVVSDGETGGPRSTERCGRPRRANTPPPRRRGLRTRMSEASRDRHRHSSRWSACWMTQPEWSTELPSEGEDTCQPASPPLIAQSPRKSLA
jgi:hypothetical protein